MDLENEILNTQMELEDDFKFLILKKNLWKWISRLKLYWNVQIKLEGYQWWDTKSGILRISFNRTILLSFFLFLWKTLLEYSEYYTNSNSKSFKSVKKALSRDIPDSLILPLEQGPIRIVAKFFPSTAAMKQTIMQLNWNDYSFPIAYILHQGCVSTIAKGRQGGKERRFFTQISPF